MQVIHLLRALLFTIFSGSVQAADALVQKPFVVVVPSYNNAKYYEKNLDSIAVQQYENYRVIYIDDSSSYGTGEMVERYLSEHDLGGRVTLVQNEKNMGALHNLYYAIHSCDDEEIVLTLDGDDWFANENVLNRINAEYQNPEVWLTYGSYLQHPSMSGGMCAPFPKSIIKNSAFRSYKWVSSQLRTFYAKLFKLIKVEDLQHIDGKFYKAAYDFAIMFPMLEMAGSHHRYISDILYFYNKENPISDHRKGKNLQRRLAGIIRKKKRYARLENGVHHAVRGVTVAQLAAQERS